MTIASCSHVLPVWRVCSQYAQCAQRIPAARFARLLHLKVDLSWNASLQRPASVDSTFIQQNAERRLHPVIPRDPCILKMVEGTQDVVPPTTWETQA